MTDSQYTPDDPLPSVTVGVDSYVSLDDANTIITNRLFSRAWGSDYDRDNIGRRCVALRTATALLDRMRWKGRPVAHGQPLAWPRVPERCPHGYPLTVDIPTAISTACAELAIHLLTTGQLTTSHVQTQMVGDTMLTYFPTIADELPKHVRRLIEPHLIASSANTAEVTF